MFLAGARLREPAGGAAHSSGDASRSAVAIGDNRVNCLGPFF
jgi:hypothetical protein